MKTKTPPDSTVFCFSDFIEDRRSHLGLTYDAIAACSGVCSATVKRIAYKAGDCSYGNVRKILKGLGYTLQEYAAWEKSHLENA